MNRPGRQTAVGGGRAGVERWLPAAFCVLLALVAAAPLLLDPGFLNTRGIGDSPNLLFRVHQLIEAWRGGEFPARWMPDADYGYGFPYFTYYASFSTHVAALLKLYGFSFVTAIKLTQLAALIVGALAMWAWARRLGLGRASAGLAAAAYTFAPFHIINLYVRGDSLAELWAMAVFPLTLWAAQRLTAQASFGRALVLAASVAVLVCTHNISALLFLPFLGLYVLLAARPWSPVTVYSFLALIWGLGLSAFFWLPALAEQAFVQLADLTQGHFFYGHHFRGGDLVQPSIIFDPESNPFSMGLVQAGAAALGLGLMLWRAWRFRRWPWLNTFILIGLAASTLMITPLSRPLWGALPLVAFTQFPWRFLAIQAIFTALATAALVRTQPAESDHPWPLAVGSWGVTLGLTAVLALACFARLRLDFIPLTDHDVTAARLNLYEYFTTAIGNTVNSEYLPAGVTPRPFTSEAMLGRAPRLKALSGSAAGVRDWKSGSREQWTIRVADGAPATVAVPTHFWPGWSAAVDGRAVDVRAAPSLGWIAFDLPPGSHVVTLRLGRTPVRAGAELFSLAAWTIPLAAQIYRRRRALPLSLAPRRLVAPAVLLGLGLAGLVSLHARPQTPISDLPLSMDFDTAPYAHHAPIHFAGGATLARVEYSTDRLERGGPLTVNTEWSGPAGQATLRLVSPAHRLAPGLPPLDAATFTAGGRSTAVLTIPPGAAPGMYFVAVEHSGGPAVSASGRVRSLVHLGPIWVDGPPIAVPAEPMARFGPSIELMSVAADSRSVITQTPSLIISLLWRALTDVPRNYPVALRLRDADGGELASLDAQTGYGFYPTHLWRPGEVIPDGYALALPPGVPPAIYTTTLTLYDPLDLQPLGTLAIAAPLSAPAPRAGAAARWALAPELGLASVLFPPEWRQGDSMGLTAEWLTAAAPERDYRARWTLTGLDGSFVRQVLPLAPGSRASDWPADARLIDRARFGVPADLPPGTYALSIVLVDERDQ